MDPAFLNNYISKLFREYLNIISIAENKFMKSGIFLVMHKIFSIFRNWFDYQKDLVIRSFLKIFLRLDNETKKCVSALLLQIEPLRENGSTKRRAYLFRKYRYEIEKIGCNYQIIKGFNQERFNLAVHL